MTASACGDDDVADAGGAEQSDGSKTIDAGEDNVASLGDGGRKPIRDSGREPNEELPVGDGGNPAADAGPDAGEDGGSPPDCEPSDEICNDRDDDCDRKVDEDLDVGVACDSDDLDRCKQGRIACDDDGDAVCVEGPAELRDETCDDLDNDCDGDIDEDFELLRACDGSDGDLCTDGVTVCNDDGDDIECDDDASEEVELCDGVDNDCDPSTDDGSGDDRVGASCDGTDSDLCTEGSYSCGDDGLVCSDETDSNGDLCNGLDDDCDPATPDGSSEPTFGSPCDGGDADLCNEGTLACAGQSGMTCTDSTSSIPDVCNDFDDDCDPATLDGSGDPLLGQSCDGPDSDFCLEGTYDGCAAATLHCNDETFDNEDTCNTTDDDCDGATDESYPAVCGGNNSIVMSSIIGDGAASGPSTDQWTDTVYDTITITEGDMVNTVDLTATITLVSPAGSDFDLYVYSGYCGDVLLGSSTSGVGATDAVNVTIPDDPAADNSTILTIHVSQWSRTTCDMWMLNVSHGLVVDPI